MPEPPSHYQLYTCLELLLDKFCLLSRLLLLVPPPEEVHDSVRRGRGVATGRSQVILWLSFAADI